MLDCLGINLISALSSLVTLGPLLGNKEIPIPPSSVVEEVIGVKIKTIYLLT